MIRLGQKDDSLEEFDGDNDRKSCALLKDLVPSSTWMEVSLLMVLFCIDELEGITTFMDMLMLS